MCYYLRDFPFLAGGCSKAAATKLLHFFALVFPRFLALAMNATGVAIPMSNIQPHTPTQQTSADFKHDHAYKYYGYPEFCRLLATSNDFFVLRRFGALNARVLLTMQNNIVEIENRLLELDQECAKDPDPSHGRLDSLAWDKDQTNRFKERADKVEALWPLLHQYSTLQLVSSPRHH
jgi:hypothetical protein